MIANLRQATPPGMRFGDPESEQAYFRDVETARRAGYRQGFSHVVAPLHSVTTPSGRVIKEGEQVKLEDFNGDATEPAHQMLRRHIEHGHVLEAYACAG
jgi:hypothetical protein